MAWTKVKELDDQQQCTLNKTDVEHTRVFIVRADGSETTYGARLATLAGVTIPVRGEAHPDHANALCHKISIKRMDPKAKVWNITCEYTTNAEFGAAATSPLSRPIKYTYETQKVSKPIFRDKNDDLILNSAGDTFETMPEVQESQHVIVAVKNLSSFNPETMASYENTVNSGAFTINGQSFAAGKLLMDSISAEKITEDGTTYYQVTFRILVSATDWQLHLLDIGYNELDGADLIPILNADGSPLETPWPLAGGVAAPFKTDPTIVLDFDLYQDSAWTGISL